MSKLNTVKNFLKYMDKLDFEKAEQFIDKENFAYKSTGKDNWYSFEYARLRCIESHNSFEIEKDYFFEIENDDNIIILCNISKKVKKDKLYNCQIYKDNQIEINIPSCYIFELKNDKILKYVIFKEFNHYFDLLNDKNNFEVLINHPKKYIVNNISNINIKNKEKNNKAERKIIEFFDCTKRIRDLSDKEALSMYLTNNVSFIGVGRNEWKGIDYIIKRLYDWKDISSDYNIILIDSKEYDNYTMVLFIVDFFNYKTMNNSSFRSVEKFQINDGKLKMFGYYLFYLNKDLKIYKYHKWMDYIKMAQNNFNFKNFTELQDYYKDLDPDHEKATAKFSPEEISTNPLKNKQHSTPKKENKKQIKSEDSSTKKELIKPDDKETKKGSKKENKKQIKSENSSTKKKLIKADDKATKKGSKKDL